MNRRSPSLSERVYRRLLSAYPANFRREYGDEMALCFRDLRRDCGEGALAIFRLWMHTLADLASSALEEHMDSLFKSFQEGSARSATRFLGLAALALLVAGGVNWVVWGAMVELMTRPERWRVMPIPPVDYGQPGPMFWLLTSVTLATILVVFIFSAINFLTLRKRDAQFRKRRQPLRRLSHRAR